VSIRPNPLAAYKTRRSALVIELAEVRSNTATKQVELALFVGDVAIATIYDLEQTITRIAESFQSELARRNFESKAELEELQKATTAFHGTQSVTEWNMSKFKAAIALLSARSSLNAANLTYLQHELLSSMGLMWIELLQNLYEADDRRVFFARLELIIDFASSKLPVVGEILETIKLAAEVYAVRKMQARDADSYLLSLESFIDAANAYITGVLAFCEATDRYLSGRTPASDSEFHTRIAAHIASVQNRTHVASQKNEA
jgi:hypothetical protein